jgi:hypothetical protein
MSAPAPAVSEVCTCAGRLVKIGPHTFQCRACGQLWRDDHPPAPGWLMMVDQGADLPPWFPGARIET